MWALVEILLMYLAGRRKTVRFLGLTVSTTSLILIALVIVNLLKERQEDKPEDKKQGIKLAKESFS